MASVNPQSATVSPMVALVNEIHAHGGVVRRFLDVPTTKHQRKVQLESMVEPNGGNGKVLAIIARKTNTRYGLRAYEARILLPNVPGRFKLYFNRDGMCTNQGENLRLFQASGSVYLAPLHREGNVWAETNRSPDAPPTLPPTVAQAWATDAERGPVPDYDAPYYAADPADPSRVILVTPNGDSHST